MSSWMHYIIESKDSEQALERLKEQFDLEEAKEIRILDEYRIFIEQGQLVKDELDMYPDVSEIQEKWINLSDIVKRVMKAGGSDTSDVVHGNLYEIHEDGVKDVKKESSYYWYLQKDEEHENLTPSPYQGHSFLPAYFYRKFDFKMIDKADSNVDFSETYQPSEDYDDYKCPYCGSSEVKVKGWDGKCDNCKFEKPEPWFKHDEFRNLARFSKHKPPKGVELTKDNPFVNSEIFEEQNSKKERDRNFINKLKDKLGL